MAIVLKFITLVAKKSAIQKKYPDGWDGFIRDIKSGRVHGGLYDDYLFARHSMSMEDVESDIKNLRCFGLEPLKEETINGVLQTVWNDCCIAETSQYDCEWLEYSEDGSSVFLKGDASEKIASRLTEDIEVTNNKNKWREYKTELHAQLVLSIIAIIVAIAFMMFNR